MKITDVKSFIISVPLELAVEDSTSHVELCDLVVVNVETDEGITGWGYTLTAASGDLAIKALIDNYLAPEVIGKDPFLVKKIWDDAYLRTHYVGLFGVAFMGISSIETALWDIIAKKFEVPLWKVLGGYNGTKVPAYNTNGGWLSLSIDQLVDNAKSLVDQGFKAVKIKVGGPDPREDYRRIGAVRKAIGDDIKLMVDVNTKWDITTAIKWGRRLEDFDIFWLEEPLHPHDIKNTATLAAALDTPIMVGENICSLHAWRDFIEAKAVDIVQACSLKLGGITRWMEVAALAHANGLPVVPAVPDMMQIHIHLLAAIPNGLMSEYVPWMLHIFKNPVQLEDGYLLVPQEPGIGIDMKEEAIQKYGVSERDARRLKGQSLVRE